MNLLHFLRVDAMDLSPKNGRAWSCAA